jgi:predicted RNA-binding Zn-ribbon protein involved in translation (DUF1610 family)
VIDLILLILLIPGAAFMLFLAYGMWMAFQTPASPGEHPTLKPCPHCGHDLTEITSQSCPECGKAII